MKLYSIDNDYLNYTFANVDREVMFSHTSEKGRGRANVLVMQTNYKGYEVDFAIPEIGDISQKKFEERDFVGISSQKHNGKNSSGFAVNKLMPIEISLLVPFLFQENPQFRQIATEITHKERELIAKTQAHLKRLEVGEKVKFSTNIDKQLVFLDAYITLRRMGESERTIYGRSFAENVRRANGKL